MAPRNAMPLIDFHAFIEPIDDGARQPLDLVMYEPVRLTDRDGYACRVDCPAINGTDERTFYGATRDEALRAARIDTFLGLGMRAMLGIVDAEGRPVPLPDIDIIQYQEIVATPRTLPVLAFEGQVRDPDGSIEPGAFAIFPAQESSNGDCTAAATCSWLWNDAVLVSGFDEEAAEAAAAHFIYTQMHYRAQTLLDAAGKEVGFPDIPYRPVDDRDDILMRFEATARKPDGREHDFWFALCEPKPDADGIWYCRLICSVTPEYPFVAPGRDRDKAVRRALGHAERLIHEHFGGDDDTAAARSADGPVELFDKNGQTVAFPSPPDRADFA